MVSLYETLRSAVVTGQGDTEGMAALCFHGMYQGLAILRKTPPTLQPPSGRSTDCNFHCSSEFVQLLANLILHTYEELTHVC